MNHLSGCLLWNYENAYSKEVWDGEILTQLAVKILFDDFCFGEIRWTIILHNKIMWQSQKFMFGVIQ